MKEPPQISKSSHNVIILRQSSEHYKENSEQKLKMANDIQKKTNQLLFVKGFYCKTAVENPIDDIKENAGKFFKWSSWSFGHGPLVSSCQV